MKSIITSSIAILIATLIAAAMPTEAEARIYEDTIRLHILAASDSEEDQALKLRLRDELLKKYGERLSGARDIDSAEAALRELLPELEEDCNLWVKRWGWDYKVTAELSAEWYDTRVYEDFTLPRGTYTSLIIRIGEGEGKNWWCVMFPPLCLDMATEPMPEDDLPPKYSKEESKLIAGGKYNIKFKLLELFSGAFFKKG